MKLLENDNGNKITNDAFRGLPRLDKMEKKWNMTYNRLQHMDRKLDAIIRLLEGLEGQVEHCQEQVSCVLRECSESEETVEFDIQPDVTVEAVQNITIPLDDNKILNVSITEEYEDKTGGCCGD